MFWLFPVCRNHSLFCVFYHFQFVFNLHPKFDPHDLSYVSRYAPFVSTMPSETGSPLPWGPTSHFSSAETSPPISFPHHFRSPLLRPRYRWNRTAINNDDELYTDDHVESHHPHEYDTDKY